MKPESRILTSSEGWNIDIDNQSETKPASAGVAGRVTKGGCYLAGTWRWKAAVPLLAPGDTAAIFRLKNGFVKIN